MGFHCRSSINTLFLGISEDEALFARRGFAPAAPQKQQHLENIGRTFIAGYRLALCGAALDELRGNLDQVEPEYRGFAFEGAGMALALTDALWRQDRFAAFLHGPGAAHCYMLHVGYGWAAGRLPWMRWDLARTLRGLDPLLGSLMIDGYGFHEGYFHWRSAIAEANIPGRVRGYFARQFDQGLGRALWFFNGADPGRTVECLHSFPHHRHDDLWSGIGLAAAYAGAATEGELEWLRDAAGDSAGRLAQGAAFAATARHRAGNVVAHTAVATGVFCGRSVTEAAAITDAALEAVCAMPEPYERWRAEIRRRMRSATAQRQSA